MYLIVGLGNPGREYQNTRHNIGFRYLDFFCEEHQIEMDRSKMNGIYGETMLQGEKSNFTKTAVVYEPFWNCSAEVCSIL